MTNNIEKSNLLSKILEEIRNNSITEDKAIQYHQFLTEQNDHKSSLVLNKLIREFPHFLHFNHSNNLNQIFDKNNDKNFDDKDKEREKEKQRIERQVRSQANQDKTKKEEEIKKIETEKEFFKLTVIQQQRIVELEYFFFPELREEVRYFMTTKGSIEQKTKDFTSILQKQIPELKAKVEENGVVNVNSNVSPEILDQSEKIGIQTVKTAVEINAPSETIIGASSVVIGTQAAKSEQTFEARQESYEQSENIGNILNKLSGKEKTEEQNKSEEKQKEEITKYNFITSYKEKLIVEYSEKIRSILENASYNEKEKQYMIEKIDKNVIKTFKFEAKEKGIDLDTLSKEEKLTLATDNRLSLQQQILLYKAIGLPEVEYKLKIVERENKEKEINHISYLSREEQLKLFYDKAGLIPITDKQQQEELIKQAHKEGFTKVTIKDYEKHLENIQEKENNKTQTEIADKNIEKGYSDTEKKIVEQTELDRQVNYNNSNKVEIAIASSSKSE